MIAAVTTVWEPLSVAALVLIAVFGGARWIIDRTDRRFDRIEDRLFELGDRVVAIEPVDRPTKHRARL
jgi:hypothetical protein